MIPILIAGVVGVAVGAALSDGSSEGTSNNQNDEDTVIREVPSYKVPAHIRRKISEQNNRW